MNKDQALKEFIRKNMANLTSSSLDRRGLKSIVKSYFIDAKSKKFGIPNNKEVSESLINFMIKNGVSREDIRAQIEILPIFSYHSKEKLLLLVDSDVSGDDSVFMADELRAIKKISSLDVLARKSREEIENAALEDAIKLEEERDRLAKDIESKKKEFDSLPSVLDEEFSEPDFSPEKEDFKPWWERFYLKSNPFPGNKDGLSRVEISLYESVVVKTKPFRDYMAKIERDPNAIFDTANMLVGDFGYGKTTFQDYMAHQLASKNILPIRITCIRAHPDSSGYLDHLLIKLHKRLAEEVGLEQTTISLMDPDVVVDVAAAACQKWTGIVIFLDDYHKHRSEYSAVYDFLGKLQMLKDSFVRASCNVGFIVSGVPLWLRQMKEHAQMSGFFDSSPIVLPEATPEFICDVFNSRIQAYCYDGSPRKIQFDYIEKIFSKSGRGMSCRDYLNAIIEQLENNNLSIVSTPIDISDDVILDIKNIFSSDAILNSCINKLIYESRFSKFNSEQISKCLEILVMIHSQGGINEAEVFFQDNAFYFKRLKDVGLISKQRNHGSDRDYKWVCSKQMRRVSEDVKAKHSLTLNDYFLKIYYHRPRQEVPVTEHTKDAGLISRFKAFIRDNKDKISSASYVNIQDSLVLLDKFDVDPSSKDKRDSAVADMYLAINKLGFALFDIDGTSSFFSCAEVSDVEKMWMENPIDDDIITEFYKRYKNYMGLRDSMSYSVISTHARDVVYYVCDYIKDVLSDYIFDLPDSFRYAHKLTCQSKDDLDIYSHIKADLFSANRESHFRYLSMLTNHIERTIRSFLYSVMVCVYGPDSYRNFCPKGVHGYAHRNTDFKTYGVISNFFDGFTRPQYRQIFEDAKLRSMIFDCMDVSWSEDSKAKFFDLFAEENINTAHQKMSSFSPDKRGRYIAYCQLALDFISSINVMVSRLVVDNCYVIPAGESSDIDDCIFKFGFKYRSGKTPPGHVLGSDDDVFFSKNEDICSHILEAELYERVRNSILSKVRSGGYYIENMIKIDFISSHYSVKYSEFVSALGYMHHVSKEVVITPWIGGRIGNPPISNGTQK